MASFPHNDTLFVESAIRNERDSSGPNSTSNAEVKDSHIPLTRQTVVLEVSRIWVFLNPTGWDYQRG